MTDEPEPANAIGESGDHPLDAISRPIAFRDVPWSWTDLAIGLAPLILWRLAVYGISVSLTTISQELAWIFYAVSLVLCVWIVAFPIGIARRRHARFLSPSIGRTLIESALAVLLLPGIWIVLALLYAGWTLLGPSDPINPSLQAGAGRHLGWLGFFFVLAVIVAPLGEEIFFRGMLYSALRRSLHPVAAAAVQAILFGLVHPYSTMHSIMAGIFGAILALIYEWRRTLVTPIAIHALNNSLALGAAILIALWSPLLGLYGDPHERGCIITAVTPESGAEAAGLRVGDIVVSVAGEPVEKIQDMAAIVKRRCVGETVVVEYLRDGEMHRVEAVLKNRFQ